MKKLIPIIILSMFLISFVSPFSDDQLPPCYGLDEELIICFNPSDDELVFLAGNLPDEALFTGFGMGADYLTTPPEELPPEIPPSLLEELKYNIFFLLALSLFFICGIFIYLKRRKKRLLLIADDDEKENEK